jgi:hypothetical protein
MDVNNNGNKVNKNEIKQKQTVKLNSLPFTTIGKMM